jgi:hypothetical protein
MTGESHLGGKVPANQQARRPAVTSKFGTFPIRYRQMIDTSAFYYAKVLELLSAVVPHY